MKYFKHIDLEGWKGPTLKVHKFVRDQTQILQGGAFWNILSKEKHDFCYQQLSPVFEKAGFNLLRISFLVLNGEESDIHQDKDFIPGFPDRLARINLPVLNCEGTETHFYSSLKWDPIVKTLPNGIKYAFHPPEHCKLEGTVSITKPTIIRVRELHSVANHTKIYPRITLTCAVDPDPVYLLED